MTPPTPPPASEPISSELGGSDRRHPVFARAYARAGAQLEDAGMRELRRELLDGLAGTVVEVGAGNGLCLPHYPASVTRVHAVEPEPHLRGLLTEAAARAAVPVTVHAARAEHLPLPDDSADAVVLCLVLCSFDDRPAALAEVCRVLRPGGTVRFLEHTVADTPGLRRLQRVVDATVWPHLTGGCRTSTDTIGLLTAAGLAVTALRRFRFPETRVPQPAAPHVLGTAGPRAHHAPSGVGGPA
jgi:ubiquinone/menaquinone biosynthesis C-methylase UbiE